MTAPFRVSGRTSLTFRITACLLLASTAVCVHTAAERTTSPYRTNFAEVCPDRNLFPPSGAPGLRNSYAESWQRDYPAIVYNARDGKGYWLDYGQNADPGNMILLDSLFTPVTYTAEKIIVFVCGLHFEAKATAVPTTQTIPDGGPQIDLTAAASALPTVNAPPAETGPPPSGGPEAQQANPNTHSANQPSDACTEATSLAAKLDGPYKGALDEMKRVLKTSGIFENSPFSFENLATEIADRTPTPSTEDPHNLTAFQSSLSKEQYLANRLSTSIAGWNAFLQSKEFTSAWTALGDSENKAEAIMKEYEGANCTQNNEALIEDRNRFGHKKKKLEKAALALRQARRNLLNAYKVLDDWYYESSVSTVLILPPVSANSLTQIAVNVTDPWVPLAPAVMVIGSVKPVKASPPAQTVITIDRTNATKPTITVTGSGSNASIATTMADDSGKPAVNVQITQPGSTAASVAPAGQTAPNATTSASAANASVPADVQPSSSAPSSTKGSGTPVVASSTAPNAAYLVARHRWVNFVPSAGLLVTRFNPPNYNVETLPLTTNTTTTTTTSTCTPTATPPCSPTVTITSAASTANFAYNSPGGNFQQTAIAGITWYPWGRDTYSVTHISRSGRPDIDTYAAHSWASRLGVFAGSSIASLGTFAVSPTFEVKPGIELFTGLTLASKTSLAQGVVPCGSVGSSTINEPPVTSSSGPPGGPTTTTTVNVQLITGCATANATMLGGTTVPTQTALVPAFSFGFLLNANLFQFLNF